jgi:glycosyltransferase involved in cell wall biosynthesis
MPLVSVIVPFLDPDEDFFREAIGSVRAQSVGDWELLLVDDGSGVRATEFALRVAESCPGKIRYLEHEGHRNRGISASRNLGLRNAGGRYAAFIDADDLWIETKLERQTEVLETNPEASMLFGNSLYWYGWTGLTSDAEQNHVPSLGTHTLAIVDPPQYLTLVLRGRVAVPCMNSVIARLDAVMGCGGFEDSFPGLYEDQAFYAKMWLRYPVYVMSECWDKYRRHPNSMTIQADRAKALDEARLAYMNWLNDYLREQGYEGTEVWRAARTERLVCAAGGVGRIYRRTRRLARRALACAKLTAT